MPKYQLMSFFHIGLSLVQKIIVLMMMALIAIIVTFFNCSILPFYMMGSWIRYILNMQDYFIL